MKIESKLDKFKRLAEARTNKALKQFELLANLGGSQYNDGSDELADAKHAIIKTLMDTINDIEIAWQQKGKNQKKEAFKL